MAFTVNLMGSDKKTLEIDFETAKTSSYIVKKLEKMTLTNRQSVLIHLRKIDGLILKRIVEWMEHHKDDPTPKRTDFEYTPIQKVSDWDREFLNVDNVSLISLIRVANTMGIDTLNESASKIVASRLKGKSPEEMIAEFKIELSDEKVKKKLGIP